MNNLFFNAAKITANQMVKKFTLLGIDSGDLINDAWLYLHDKGEEITLANLKKEIVNFAYLKNYECKHRHGIIYANSHSDTSVIFCRSCQQDLPYYMFGVATRKRTGERLIQTYCSVCQAKKMNKIYHKNHPHAINRKRILYPEILTTKKQRQAYKHKIWSENNKDKLRINRKNYI